MDKATKKRMKRYLAWLCMAGVVVLLTVMPLLAKSEAEADGPQASILIATAETGSITRELRGGGNLEDLDAEDVNIPTGVKITEFLVKNGDIVTEGMPVAMVDKTSVMSAIVSVSETMEYLQEALEDGRNEKVDERITAVPGGRVKKIFAQEGESVQEVMLRDGALAVLSIDGLMAVKIENQVDATTGQSVLVRIPNFTAEGKVVTGRVESNLNGVKVVTIEDEGYAAGTEVTVSTLDGEAIGSGTLYIHNAWKATAYAGSVSRIHAKEEQTLSEGATLFTLDDREFEGQLQHRASQHREYTELLQRLLKMYESGTITAPCDGIVSGVDSQSAHLLAAEEKTWDAELLANSGSPKYRIVFLSSTSEPVCDGTENCQASTHNTPHECIKNTDEHTVCPGETNHHESCISRCTKADQEAACTAKNHYSDCIRSCQRQSDAGVCTSRKHYPDCIEKCDPTKGTACPATGTHRKTCIMRCAHGDTDADCDAEGKHHSDCIHSCTGNEQCAASKHRSSCFFSGMTFTAYALKVEAPASGALIGYTSGRMYYVEKQGSSWILSNGASLDEKLLVNQATVPAANAAMFKKGDIVLVVTGQNADGSKTWNGVVMYKPSSLPTGGFGGMDISGLLGGMDLSALMGGMGLSGMMGGFAGFGNYGAMPSGETETLHDLQGSTLMTVTPHRTMVLPITLDEQDISKVTVGMSAQVKVEALKNQVFPATVTKVGIRGTNNGGSSKFTVELTLDAVEEMIPGMSATASIALETKEDVLTVPLAAVYEEDGQAVVFTALDPDSQEPGSPVTVKTGASDGEQVEILEGLDPGDKVYYAYYDVLELDTSAEAQRFTFG